jgi:hypothetical protein
MTHRDLISIPLLTGSFTASIWLPSVSQIQAGSLWGMGIILMAVQIRYYWKNTPKK